MALFTQVSDYTPVNDDNNFAVIVGKNIVCEMDIVRKVGDKTWNEGADLVEVSLKVAEGQAYAGRFLGFPQSFNLDQAEGETVTTKDGRSFETKSGMKLLSNFIFRLNPDLADISDEAKLDAALGALDGQLVKADGFKRKNDTQGARVKELFTDEIIEGSTEMF